MDACAAFAESTASLSYGRLSDAAVEAAKRGVLDTMGVALAATGLAADEARPIVELVRDWGGKPESTALGYGWKVPAPWAALVFGALSHMLDYDDIVDSAVSHPSAPVVAAALPLAERLGEVTGKDLIVAIAAGQDLAIRLNMAIQEQPPYYGWLPSINGVYGSVLTASKLLGLSTDQTVNALGLALHQTGGSRQCGSGLGSSYRGVRDGFNAKTGLMCALLAQQGMRGDQEAFEGDYGLFNIYFRGEYDRDTLLDGLGTTMTGELIGYKPWPSCGFSHLFIAPLTKLMAENDFEPSDVTRIVALSNEDLLESQCTPAELRTRPQHAIDAKQSLPFQLGKVLVTGNLVLDDFTPAGMRDDAASAVADLVRWRVEEFPGVESKLGVGRIELELADGRCLAEQTEHAPGGPDEPLSWEQLADKFRDCVAHSVSPVPVAQVEDAISCIGDLEKSANVSGLVEMVSAGT
jgi:2-methylcitrate dehydratase PrpD